jgi:hypothetical protein
MHIQVAYNDYIFKRNKNTHNSTFLKKTVQMFIYRYRMTDISIPAGLPLEYCRPYRLTTWTKHTDKKDAAQR